MTSSLTRGRKALVALFAATVIAGAMAPGVASAGGGHGHGGHGWHGGHGGHGGHGWHGRRHGYGYGYGAFGGGLLLGAIAANAYDRECWTERRRFVNAYGNVVVRRIRVCE